MTTFGIQFPQIFEPNPMGWQELQFNGETLLEEKTAKCVKAYLRKKGIEVRRLPLEFSENFVFVRVKDVPKVSKLFKHISLKKLCDSI